MLERRLVVAFLAAIPFALPSTASGQVQRIRTANTMSEVMYRGVAYFSRLAA